MLNSQTVNITTAGMFKYVVAPSPVNFTPEKLTRIFEIRNFIGCHYNELSFSMLDSDALGFGRQVLEVMNAMTDGDAGWPKNGNSGEYWATAGETRRLYPFRKPS